VDAAELRALGIDPAVVVDFSASINPLGPPPRVREAVERVDFAQYPDRHCQALRDALSARLEVEPDEVLVGNGSTELVHLLARAYLGKGKRAFLFTPTFGEYEAACDVVGAPFSVSIASEAAGFQWDMEKALEAIHAQRPRLVFLCNPSNPTGVYLSRAAVERVATAVQETGLLVLDEAYLSFTDGAWDSRSLLDLRNVVLLRSMTKDYALAGLRLGYLVAQPDVVSRVRQLQPSWSVNAMAQAAGLAALGSEEYLEEARQVISQSKRYLLREISSLGLEVAPPSANFLLVKVGDAAALRLKLMKLGFCVRDCASFGLQDYIRVGVRKLGECRRLVAALKEVLASG